MILCVADRCLFLLEEHSPEWRFHKSLVCHEDVPHTQHPHHHDLVLETHHPPDQTTCAAGEVRLLLLSVSVLLFCNHI